MRNITKPFSNFLFLICLFQQLNEAWLHYSWGKYLYVIWRTVFKTLLTHDVVEPIVGLIQHHTVCKDD